MMTDKPVSEQIAECWSCREGGLVPLPCDAEMAAKHKALGHEVAWMPVSERATVSDEAKEIERLTLHAHKTCPNLVNGEHLKGFTCPWGGHAIINDSRDLARRLLDERNEARRTDSPKADAPDEITNLRERIASLEREVASYEGMDRAVTHYQEEVRRLEQPCVQCRAHGRKCER